MPKGIRRSDVEISIDLLSKLPAQPTRLMYDTHLSWISMQRKVNIFLINGLMVKVPSTIRDKRLIEIYEITEKGREALAKLIKIRDDIEAGDVIRLTQQKCF